MQDDKEKLLQQIMESGKPQQHTPTITDQEDFTAYKILYSGLKKEMEGGFSLSFKSKVLRQIRLEKARRNDIKLYVIAGIVVIIGLIFMTFIVFSHAYAISKYADVIIKIVVFLVSALLSLTVFSYFEKKYLKLEN
jgi:hypothetical protein